MGNIEKITFSYKYMTFNIYFIVIIKLFDYYDKVLD